MTRLISRVELARLARVSKPAITKACKGKLAAACTRDRVDLDHAAVQAYLASKGVNLPPEPERQPDAAPTPPAKPARRKVAAPTKPALLAEKGTAKPPTKPTKPEAAKLEPSDIEGPEGILEDAEGIGSDELAKLNRALRPILARHGTRRGFRDWLVALKDLEDIRKKRLDNDETEGRLISRELVKTHVFGAIEGSHRRLLGDAPKTIARLLYSMNTAKEPLEAAESRVRDVISTLLKPVMATGKRALGDE